MLMSLIFSLIVTIVIFDNYLMLQLLLYRVHTGHLFIWYHPRPLRRFISKVCSNTVIAYFSEHNHHGRYSPTSCESYPTLTNSAVVPKIQIRHCRTLLGLRHMPALEHIQIFILTIDQSLPPVTSLGFLFFNALYSWYWMKATQNISHWFDFYILSSIVLFICYHA